MNTIPVFSFLAEWSRENCIGICSFLVPANLLTTLLTIILLWQNKPFLPLNFIRFWAFTFAFALIFHVSTWLIIGVVMTPTFILLGLALTCLTIQGWLIYNPQGVLQTRKRIMASF